MQKKTVIILAIIISTLIASFIPFETTFVPEWKLRVIDENGKPYENKRVRQNCSNYTLDVHGCVNGNGLFQKTDENGYVVFPERTIKLNLISRISRTGFSLLLNLLPHSSFGINASVDSSGPKGYNSIEYVPGETLPKELVLPSENAKENE